MEMLGKFGALCENFSQQAEFVTIYIVEAHASERGHFVGNYDIKTHQTMEERLEAVQTLQNEADGALDKCTIVVDHMDDLACQAYSAFPERLFVVLDGMVVYVGGIGPWDYKVDEVEQILTKMK